MYDWKEIALMYKKEVSDLHDEIFSGTEILRSALPNCNNKAAALLLETLMHSELNFDNIEIFEGTVKEKIQIHLEKPEKERKIVRGGYFKNGVISITQENINRVNELCEDIHDYKKRGYAIANKCAVLHVWDFLESMGYDPVGGKPCLDKTTLRIAEKRNKKMHTIKVVCSPLEFSGLAKELDGPPLGTLPKQHLYLLDLEEPREDKYIFCNYKSPDRLTIYAWVKGEYVDRMLIEPIRDRFKGKKGLIVQKESKTGKDFPCSVDELLTR